MQGKYGMAFFFLFFIKENVCSCQTIVKRVCTKQIELVVLSLQLDVTKIIMNSMLPHLRNSNTEVHTDGPHIYSTKAVCRSLWLYEKTWVRMQVVVH